MSLALLQLHRIAEGRVTAAGSGAADGKSGQQQQQQLAHGERGRRVASDQQVSASAAQLQQQRGAYSVGAAAATGETGGHGAWRAGATAGAARLQPPPALKRGSDGSAFWGDGYHQGQGRGGAMGGGFGTQYAWQQAQQHNMYLRRSSMSSFSQLPLVSPSAQSVVARTRHQKVMARIAALPSDASKLFLFGRPRLLLLVSSGSGFRV